MSSHEYVRENEHTNDTHSEVGAYYFATIADQPEKCAHVTQQTHLLRVAQTQVGRKTTDLPSSLSAIS